MLRPPQKPITTPGPRLPYQVLKASAGRPRSGKRFAPPAPNQRHQRNRHRHPQQNRSPRRPPSGPRPKTLPLPSSPRRNRGSSRNQRPRKLRRLVLSRHPPPPRLLPRRSQKSGRPRVIGAAPGARLPSPNRQNPPPPRLPFLRFLQRRRQQASQHRHRHNNLRQASQLYPRQHKQAPLPQRSQARDPRRSRTHRQPTKLRRRHNRVPRPGHPNSALLLLVPPVQWRCSAVRGRKSWMS